jgi:hypothetical protein
MRRTAPLSDDQGSRLVEGMMKQGTPFAEVEDAIDDDPLSKDHKAALWLLAWSLREPATQRRDALLTLELLSGRSWGHG